LSFGFSTADFEPPYFKHKFLPFPAMDLRLALVSAQVLNYATLSAGDAQGWSALAGSMADCRHGTFNLLRRLFMRRIKSFHPTYQKEIQRKFVTVTLHARPASMEPRRTASEAGMLAGASAAAPSAETSPFGNDSKKPGQNCETFDAGGDSDDDDALEAMLEAEATSGEVLFHDDFDMLNSSAGGDDFEDREDRAAPKKKKRLRRGGKGFACLDVSVPRAPRKRRKV